MEFDLQTGFCSLLIAVASAVTIYLIAALSMKGSSYDDLKASQRQDKSNQNAAIENSQGDAKKLKKMKKKMNRLAAANDDSAKSSAVEPVATNYISSGTTIGTSESDSSLSPKEAETSVETVEQIEVVKPAPKNKSKPKTGKKTKDSAPSSLPGSSVSSQSSTVDKVDVPEVKVSPESHFDKPSLPEEEADVEILPLNEKENFSNLNMPVKIKKKSKKKKNDDALDDKGKAIAGGNLNNNLKQLLPVLREMELSHSELQILIDALLNKDDDSEWYQGKQDPMLKIKKQLEEMEKLHSDDLDTINGLQAKLSSLRSEINNEKISNKGLKEALSKSAVENQSLSTKCQQSTDENQTLLNRVQQLKQQLTEDQVIIAKLEEEKLHQQQIHRASDQQEQALLSLQGQVSQLAAQLQEQQNINSSIGGQLQESLREVEEFRSMNVELNHLYNNSQFEVSRLTKEFDALKNQLEESRSQIDQYNTTISSYESTKSDLMNQVEHLKAEITKCNQEIKTFQKMADSLDEIDDNKKNGNISFPSTDPSKYQAVIDEKELIIKRLNSELSQKEASLEKLTNDIINCKNEANKKQTVIENCNVEIGSLKSLNSSIQSELSEERLLVSNLKSCLSEKSDNINKLTSEIETYRHRNNELRSKNWKVVEALEKAEHSLKDATSRLQNTAKVVKVEDSTNEIKSRVNKIMKRLDSLFTSEDCEDTEEWISRVESVILNFLDNSNSPSQNAQINKLQKMVLHYRSVITDLESMLHNLELRIESEDKKLKSIRPGSSISPEVDD